MLTRINMLLVLMATLGFVFPVLAKGGKNWTYYTSGKSYEMFYRSHDGQDGVVWIKLVNTTTKKKQYRYTIKAFFKDGTTRTENFTSRLRSGSDKEIWVGSMSSKKKVQTFRLIKMKTKTLD